MKPSLSERQLKLTQLQENMNQVIVGQAKPIQLMIVALLVQGHVLIEDVPGTGKTVLAKTLAKSIAGSCKRIQFTPDVLPSDVTGIQFFNPKKQEFELRIGPVHTNILLADEINRATPRTQSSLLEVMEEKQVTIDGLTIPMPRPFLVLATQNPVETQGTFPLPEAQLDRFLIKMNLGYPTFEEEQHILRRFRSAAPLEELSPVLEIEDILHMQEEVKDVFISEEIERYLLTLTQQTRNHANIEVGVSPRGTLAMMRAVQAKAYSEGRSYVIPDDVKELAPYVLAHRILLTLDAQLHMTEKDVLHNILEQLEVPLEEVGGR